MNSGYPASQTARRLYCTLAAFFAAGVSVALVVQSVNRFQLDLSVFRDAGRAFRLALPLYSEAFPSSSGFRFIYPPFAAVLFSPMSWLPTVLLQLAWALLNIALIWWVLRLCLSCLTLDKRGVTAALLLGPALLLEPVRSNFAFGQINIVLMAMVASDCLRAVPRFLRGTAIGVAAAVKLTPAGFALFLLARRDIQAIATATVILLSTVAVGFWLKPRDSVWFWTSEFFRDDRAGDHDFSRNQAITGVIARFGMQGPLKDAVWLIAAIVVAGAAFWAARRFLRNGEPVVAMGVVALAVLLAAPIAVTHHWVYCILLMPLMVAPQYRSWRPLLATVAVVFMIGPHVVLTGSESPSAWQETVRQIIGSGQSISGVALLVAAVLVARTRPGASGRIDIAAPQRDSAPRSLATR